MTGYSVFIENLSFACEALTFQAYNALLAVTPIDWTVLHGLAAHTSAKLWLDANLPTSAKSGRVLK
jgi:hypothetical protein